MKKSKISCLIPRILGITVTAILIIVLLCNVYVIMARRLSNDLQPDIFGWSWALVVSGSMEDKISVDDLIIVHKQKDYKEDQIISFESGKSVVTHRIIEKGDGYFVTKGDANNTPDTDPVLAENVIGRVVLVIPAVGALIRFFQSPSGFMLIALVGIGLLLWPYVAMKFNEKEN